MYYGLRKQAAEHIYQLMQISGNKEYAFSTIYNQVAWDQTTESYYFKTSDDIYSFAQSDMQ